MRSSLVVRASDGQCRIRNSPGFDPSILRHSEIWGKADEEVLNKVHKRKKKNPKNPPVKEKILGTDPTVIPLLDSVSSCWILLWSFSWWLFLVTLILLICLILFVPSSASLMLFDTNLSCASLHSTGHSNSFFTESD